MENRGVAALPLLSIIVPCHNGENTIGHALRSIPKLENVEVVVVDDASTDNSVDVLRAIVADRQGFAVTLLQNEKNLGAGESRNLGIANARGQYLTFLDCDDEFAPGACEAIIDTVNSKHCDCLMFDALMQRGERWKSFKCFISPTVKGGWVSPKEAIVYSQNPPWGKVYLRKKVTNSNARFGHQIISEDTVFTKSALACMDDIFYLDKPLYLYIERAGSLMHTRAAVDRAGVYEQIKVFLETKEGCVISQDELNNLYYTLVVYPTLTDMIRARRPSGEISLRFDKLINKYHRQDPYFDRLVPKYKLAYTLGSARLLGLLKAVIR